MEDDETETWLSELESLQPGWRDGLGNKIPSCVIKATRILLKLCKENDIEEPSFGPTEDGDIIVQWWVNPVVILITVSSSGYEIDKIRNNVIETHTYTFSDVFDLIKKAIVFMDLKK